MPSDVEHSPKSVENAELEVPQKDKASSEPPKASKERSQSVSSEEADANDKNEGKSSSSPSESTSTSPQPQQNPWQAVFAPQYNAYYFYNAATGETTWTNPLAPEASGSSSTPAGDASSSREASAAPEASSSAATDAGAGPGSSNPALSEYAALQAAALAQGIDPALAHLDPTLLAPIPGSSRGPGNIPTFTAQFNARTGAFAPTNSRTPGHLSESERAKRMSEFYFDVNAWEQDLAEQGGSIYGEEDASGKKRKRPTKKDLERFKEQKKQKKIAKTAWLRT